MSYLPILGPYEFATDDQDRDCGCGARYCTPFASGDRITFQVPAALSCCELAAGCEELNEECVSTQALTSDLSFTQATANISFTEQAFTPNEWILKGSFEFTANTKYIINFCLSEHSGDTTVKAKIGTEESSLTVSGNGQFALVVDPDIGVDTVLDWGIIVTGGTDDFTAVLSCLTVCVYREFSAALRSDEFVFIAEINRVEGATGNQIFSLPLVIPGEVESGCYDIKLTGDCGGETTNYFSQCLALVADASCAMAPTLLFKWRNQNDAFGYDYTTDTTYYNYLRVKARLKHPTFPDDTEIPTFSNNTNAVINSRIQKLWKVDINDLPDYVHNAIATMRRHSDFQIDGVNFVVGDGSYTPNWRKSSDLATSSFEAFDQSFDGVSNRC